MAELSERTKVLVEQWMKWDKNEKNRNEIQSLVDAKNEKELNKILGERIAFGTAGRSRTYDHLIY